MILAIFPWNQIEATGSPFVQIFTYVGIPSAANLLNFVVLTAALSAYNSALYSNGRMLYGLAAQGNAPKIFGKLNSSGVPMTAILVSSAITLFAVLLSYLNPEKVFLYFMSLATISIIINWAAILIVQLKFRKEQERQKSIPEFQMPLYPAATYLSLAFLVLVVGIMAFMPDMRFSLYIAPLWLAGLYVGYRMKRTARQ